MVSCSWLCRKKNTGMFFQLAWDVKRKEKLFFFFLNRETMGSGHAGVEQISTHVPTRTTPCVSALVLTFPSPLTSDILKNKNSISVMFCDLRSGCSLSRVSESCRQQHTTGQHGQSVRDCSVKADITLGAGAVSRENTVKENSFSLFSVTLLH